MTVRLPLALLVLTQAIAASADCYWRSQNGVSNQGTNWYECSNTNLTDGGAQLCCLPGSSCGPDSICHANDPSGLDEWFVGGCSDPSYSDPICRKDCTSDAQTWIVWNSTESLWDCCGSNGCDGNPTNELFSAVAPSAWTAVTSSTTASTSATAAPTMSTTSPSTTSTPTTSPTNTTSPSSGLSTGAQAGIGVACAVAGIAIIAAIVFWILWRRRAASRTDNAPRWAQDQQEQQHLDYQAQPHYGYEDQKRGYDIPMDVRPQYAQEAPPMEVRSPVELGADESDRQQLPGDESRVK